MKISQTKVAPNGPILETYDASEAVRQRVEGRDRKLICKIWRHWEPPERITVSEWAERNRVMAEGTTSEPGGYSADRLPWHRFIQDQVTNPKYNKFTICGASQTTGKTEILNNVIGYFIDHDPSAIIVAYPTKDGGDSWSKKKLVPMIESTPSLRSKIGDPKSRDGGNTVSYKKFPGGWIGVVGKNTPNKLRQQSARVTIDDEKDGDGVSSGGEGDASDLLANRSEAFANSIYIAASTPTIAGQSKIWKDLEASDWHVWDCKCQMCGEFQELKWGQMRWDKDEDKSGNVMRHYPNTARYVCVACGAEWNDIDRQRAITSGRPRATRPEAEDFGFHQNGLYKMIGGKIKDGSMLIEFVKRFLKAKKNGRESMRVWVNTFLAEPFEDTFEAIDVKSVKGRVEDYDPDVMLPLGVLRIAGSADVQHDRIEAELIGYGELEESWGLGYVTFHGDTSKPGGPWDELDKFRARTFSHPGGRTLRCTTFFVDSGNQQDRVINYTAPRRSLGVYACKGKNVPFKLDPILPRKPSLNNKQKAHQWMIGITEAKTVLYSRIMLPVPGPGSMHFPRGNGYDERYYRQLTSERRIVRYKQGRPYYIYDSGERRNEPLDIRVYALAAHRLKPFDAAALRKELGVEDTPLAPTKNAASPTLKPLGPKAKELAFEAAPLPASDPAPPAQKPEIKQPASGFQIPEYVPMHLRKWDRAKR